jgi:hypothetical protein
MASYEYNYHTGQWDKTSADGLAANTYIVREIPGDEPQLKEIPAAVCITKARQQGQSNANTICIASIQPETASTARQIQTGARRSISKHLTAAPTRWLLQEALLHRRQR